MDFQNIISTYQSALPEGELEHFSLAPFDRLGISNQSAAFFTPDGEMSGGTGYGETDEAALVSAIGELIEEWSAARAISRLETRAATLRELGEYAIDPRKLGIDAGKTFDENTPLQWVEVARWPDGEKKWVPLEYVATYGQGAQNLVTPITNGLGAGLSREAAIAHGLLELLQRDGNGLQIRSLASTTALDKSTVSDPICCALLDDFENQGVDVEVKIASTEWGFVNLYVAGIDRQDDGFSALKSAAGGEAAHPVAKAALRKALQEWGAARSRIAFMHGPKFLLEKHAPPHYLARLRSHFRASGHEPRALQAMQNWANQPLQSAREKMKKRILQVEKRVAFSDLPSFEWSGDKIALCREVARRLHEAGFEIFVADFSPGNGVFAVKMIVPGLEVETLSYGRVGKRNAQRLLERQDVQLVTRNPHLEGARRIVLTPQDEAEIGGPLWLDWRAVENLVGPLYALHREPGRHALALS